MTPFFNIDEKILNASDKALEKAKDQFKIIDEITEYNQQKVLSAFIKHDVSESHFASTTGYGYGDRGRETLDKIWADVFGAEDALVRHNFTCGTHTLATALFGVLRPGDKMLAVTGTPYDTIHSVIGLSGEGMGSLKDFGILYDEVKMKNGRLDYEAIEKAVDDSVTMVYIQRSRGYELRPSLLISEIEKVVKLAKSKNPNVIVMVDNCYGEFVQKLEPCDVGADLIAGSLIKNAGGGMARTGGYIAGRKDLVEKCAYRLTTPGLGKEVGATLGMNRELYMGLFYAPHTVGEALKSVVYISALYGGFGFDTTPAYDAERGDIVQSLGLGNEERLVAFCKGVQSGSPIDSFLSPEPWDMPGYDSKVVMAAGAFTMGSSIELSADAPIREPYYAWIQGGLTFHSAKLCALLAAQKMLEGGLLDV
ncbi:MAG TPA: methionine gamma-lyase family protein [Candidatus Eubacterium faecipullorum]|uniref:Methionine gamma-lyase family protein n=1 Tax=Candidatus Eubacterium faecipullorum TaxID=2838571 RepID=A0A9D1UEZ5_9FIRM|nr:methionine gamma-lyase family protein [Candidatus Eubacterium faecipullorum]